MEAIPEEKLKAWELEEVVNDEKVLGTVPSQLLLHDYQAFVDASKEVDAANRTLRTANLKKEFLSDIFWNELRDTLKIECAGISLRKKGKEVVAVELKKPDCPDIAAFLEVLKRQKD